MIWSREDDIRNDNFRPLAPHRIEVGLDAKGKIVGWRHRLASEDYMARAGRAAWSWFVAGCGARADNCGLAGLAQAAVEGRANRAALATTSRIGRLGQF